MHNMLRCLPHNGNTELALIAYRALHAPDNDCITGRAPHTPEGHHPPPCVVVMLHGSQLTQIVSGVPDPQSVISAGRHNPLGACNAPILFGIQSKHSQSLPKDTRLCTATRVHPLTPCDSQSTSLYCSDVPHLIVQYTQIVISTALNSYRSAMHSGWQACEAAGCCFAEVGYSR